MKATLPPGPKAPALAQYLEYSTDPYGLFERCRVRYGDTFTLRMPGQRALVFMCGPEDVDALIAGNYDTFERSADDLCHFVGERALIFMHDQRHKEMRKLMFPVFKREQMRVHGAGMRRVVDETIAGMADGEQRLLQDDMRQLSLRLNLVALFGTDQGRMREFGEHLTAYVAGMMSRSMYGAALLLSGRRIHDLLRSRGEAVRRGRRGVSRWPLQSIADHLGAIEAIMLEEIERCRGLSDEAREARSDILAMLVGARFEDGTALSDRSLCDQLLTFVIAGQETAANALAWVLCSALQSAGTFERMRAEVEQVMGDGFDPERIKELHFMGAVMNESLRLYPIPMSVIRQLKQETRFGAHVLPAGTIVVPCTYLIQRDERVWSDPAEFRPDRFLSGKHSVYEFHPFGTSAWRCIGVHLAEYMMKVVLARIVRQMSFELISSKPIRPVGNGFNATPSEGLPVKVKRLHA